MQNRISFFNHFTHCQTITQPCYYTAMLNNNPAEECENGRLMITAPKLYTQVQLCPKCKEKFSQRKNKNVLPTKDNLVS